ncbi:zinc finger HIT domain-containing protein 2 [Hyposmocoma kahamanoa]|uniref:zinc finger HIT domain-containing protein 2 n=1 Tax=Hyposmocoma kahamanoa TaxID=1477025 RepID=UPI000E6D6023|nr:zinc finger HIT domain-containing protein 2 [Hyposmocoma kahamanoa]
MSEEAPLNSSQRICGLCNCKVSKYCCPRCEIFYCSLDCYKSEKHVTCSERFYRDCVNNELASYQNDEESRNKMIDILKRMNEELGEEQAGEIMENIDELDSDDDIEVDLHERIKDIDLDNADHVWDALTEDEQNDFEALLNKGDVGSILPQWEPWWMYRRREKKIQNVGGTNKKEEEALKKCPLLRDVPKLSSLTTIQPSPAIRCNITNVIASYAFVMRYFNNEIDPVEATIYILNICDSLDNNMNFCNPITALESVAQKCLQSNLIVTDEISLDVMKQDTFLILQGPSKSNKMHYCKAALSHLHTIFSEAKSNSKTKKIEQQTKGVFSKKFPEHKSEHFPKLVSSKISKCIKKIEYYLSYIESYSMESE